MPATTTELSPGQVWKYGTRPGEEGSRITILKIDKHAQLGTIVHVSVDGLHLANAAAPRRFSPSISHLPFAEAALRRSLIGLDTRRAGNLDLSGYDVWKESFEEGEAGVWSLSVAESIDAMEKTLAQ